MASARSRNFRPPRQRGQGVVEAVVTLPVFLLLVFGVFQLFHVSLALIQLRYAAFCAARVGAVRDADIREMETAANKVLFGAKAFIPALRDSCHVEILDPIMKTNASIPTEEGFEFLKVRVHWDFPLFVPIPAISPARFDPSGFFRTVKKIPLQASWTTVNFSQSTEKEERGKNVQK